MVYWRTSFSSGTVIYAAAADKRIKAAIVQCPSVSGEKRSIAFKDRIPALFEDRARITDGGTRGTVPCIAPDLESAKAGTAAVLFPDLHAYQSFGGILECGGRWENWVTEQTQPHMLEFEFQPMIHRIAPTPLLMVVPGNDKTVLTSSQVVAFGKAQEPKKLLYLDGAGHFDIYLGDYFERNIVVQINFLKTQLY